MIRLFALSDPHLSHARPKPMGVFGPLWENHTARIADQWRATVGADDIVLVPGDISWAMKMADAREDLAFLDSLPGRKVLIRGNHDYWWTSLGKMRALGFSTLYFIQNNHVELDGIAIGGTRLWDFPFVHWDIVPRAGNGPAARPKADRAEDTEKIRAHELERLALSLSSLPASARLRIAMTHYPPLGENGLPTPLTDAIGSYNIDLCVFGHIHAPVDLPRPGEDCVVGTTRYLLTTSDHLRHKPVLVAELERLPG